VAVTLAMSTQRAAGLAAVAAAACCVAAASSGIALVRARAHGGAVSVWLLAAALAAMAARGATSAIEATLAQPAWPRVAEPGDLVELEVAGASASGPRCEVEARAGAVAMWVDLPPEVCPIARGQRLRIPVAALEVASDRALPWDPDPHEIAHTRGVDRLARADAVFVVGAPESTYWTWVSAERARGWQLSRGDDARALVVASALGLRAALSPERRAELAAAGLGHIVAVSGMNVTLGAWLVQHAFVRVGARLGGSIAFGVVASWLPLVAYVGLSGAAAPAVRSAAMLVLVGLGTLVGRPAHGLVVLLASAAAMLAWRPAWALDPGFQLSTVAMLALLTAPPRAGLIAQSWRVVWALLPISVIHFDDANGWAVASNLVAVPVFTVWVLPLAAVGWCATPWLGAAALDPAGWGAQVILDVAALFGRLPPVPLWAACVVALAFVLLRALPDAWRPKRLVAASPPLLACVATLALALAPWRTASPARGARWYAIGTPRSHATVATTDALALVCLRRPGLAAARWPRLLASLGIAGVASIDDGENEHSPHVVELRRLLARRGLLAAPVRCDWPRPRDVRRLVTACARRVGATPTIVAGPSWCRRGDGWVRLAGIDSRP
jgi:ComEC/Rec2-related protein